MHRPPVTAAGVVGASVGGCVGAEAGPSRLRVDGRAGRLALAATVLGSAVVFLNATAVDVAVPTLADDLGADVSDVQWVLTGYLVSLSALLLLGGALGDRFGRRRTYVVGLAAFAAASALCALAPTLPWLVAARVAQGVAAALVTPGSLAILQASFAPADRALTIGRWSAVSGVGAALGPVVGGWLVDLAGWQAVFAGQVPLAAAAALLAARVVPESSDPAAREQPLDLAGALLVSVLLASGSFALLRAGEGVDVTVVAAAVVAVVALFALHPVEHRAAAPVVPPGLLRQRRFLAANAVTFLVYAALAGVFLLLVVQLQTTLGYPAAAAGAASLPITGLLLVLSARAGALAQRVGPRRPLAAGALVMGVGALLLAGVDTGDVYVTGVLPGVVVFGVGLSLIVAPVTASALAAASDAQAGVASAVNNAVSRVASLLAVVAVPLAAGLSGSAFRDPAQLSAGYPTALRLTAALAALGAVVAWVAVRDDDLAVDDPQVAARRHPRSCPVAGPPPVPQDHRGELRDVG